jgi:LmbE family N-acetylglucosaminyl deacetylase
VLAAIQPHADDIPYFGGGLVAKLVAEGYTAYMIRTTNDDCTGPGTVGDGVLGNETDNNAIGEIYGCKKTYNLNYRNHRNDEEWVSEMRMRLIFLFRLLRVNTLVSFDPWGLYEENPDHYIIARAVEAARWMSGMRKDYPEQLLAGLKPQSVTERYYYARGPQHVNRIVDTTKFIHVKAASLVANKSQGGGGNAGVNLRNRLAAQGKRLPLLDGDEHNANVQYVKEFLYQEDRLLGQKFGLDYAEAYHYIGAVRNTYTNDYIEKNSVPLK